jgi:antitoxin HicB
MSADKYTISIEKDEDGVFVACCPELPGCISQGSTEAEARNNLEEARQGYLECLARCGEEVPPACSLPLKDGGNRS